MTYAGDYCTEQKREHRQIEVNAFAALKELTGAHAWNVVNKSL